MAVNDIYEVVLVSAVNGQRVVNVFHLKEVTACTDGIPARSLALAFEDDPLPTLFLALSADAVGQCLYVRRIKPTPGIPFLRVLAAVVGAIANDAIVSNAAAVLTLYSNHMGDSGRGRKFISGIPESSTTGGQLNNTGLDLLQAFADLLEQGEFAPPGAEDGEWKPVIYSPKDGVAYEVEVAVVQPNLGNMRSRREPFGMVP